jgi:hypothetical protein
MLRKCLWQVGLALPAFALGFLMARALPAQAEAKGKAYELRVYKTLPGRLDALNQRFRDHTTKLFEKHGMTNIGYWVPQDEPDRQNTLIYVLAHDSREAAKKSFDAFRNDPAWKKAQAESEANGKIVEKVTSTFMDPTDYSRLK